MRLLAPRAELRLLVTGGASLVQPARLGLLGEALRALLVMETRALTVRQPAHAGLARPLTAYVSLADSLIVRAVQMYDSADCGQNADGFPLAQSALLPLPTRLPQLLRAMPLARPPRKMPSGFTALRCELACSSASQAARGSPGGDEGRGTLAVVLAGPPSVLLNAALVEHALR